MPDDNTRRQCPVAFDHHSPEHRENWQQTYQMLRKECPRVWSDSYGGYWVATKYMDIIRIAQQPERFYVEKTFDTKALTASGGVSIPPNPRIRKHP